LAYQSQPSNYKPLANWLTRLSTSDIILSISHSYLCLCFSRSLPHFLFLSFFSIFFLSLHLFAVFLFLTFSFFIASILSLSPNSFSLLLSFCSLYSYLSYLSLYFFLRMSLSPSDLSQSENSFFIFVNLIWVFIFYFSPLKTNSAII